MTARYEPGCRRSAERSIVVLLVVALVCAIPTSSAWSQVSAPAAPAAEADFSSDPVVAAVLETRPRTAEQLLRAVNLLVDLKRPAAAKSLLEQLMAIELDDAGRAALVDQFGTAIFVKLSAQAELQPEGAQFASDALAAVERRAADPAQLAELIEQLQNPSPGIRRAATMRLRKAGEPAVIALLQVLADPTRAAEHEVVRGALVGGGPEALPLLIGALESSDAAFVAQVIEVLGRLERVEPTEATSVYCPTPHLLGAAYLEELPAEVTRAARAALLDVNGRVPSAAEAATALRDHVQRYREMADAPYDEFATMPERLQLWHWDADAGQVVSETVEPRQALVQMAARHAYAATTLAPQDRRLRRMYLATLLEAEAYRLGPDARLAIEPGSVAAEVATLGVDGLVDLLQYALETDNAAAAAATARLLGETAEAEILQTETGRASTLVAALRHPDRAVRFAALEAILQLNARRPFAGSSEVTSALGYFVATIGRPRAFVADVRSEEGSRLAALLTELGYEAEAAVDGRQLLMRLTASPDAELLLVWIGMPRPTAFDLLTAVRRDPRTARLPVGVVASIEDFDRAEHLVRDDLRAMSLMRPHNVPGLEVQITRLAEMAQRDRIPTERRLAQARQALRWLLELSRKPRGVYQLDTLEPQLLVALSHPELSADAAAVLATIATPTAQRGLVDLASRYNLPIDMRRAARDAFCQHVERYGVQLTGPEILLQYDRYAEGEELDTESHELLGSVIDCIEARHAPHTPLK